MYNLTFNFSFAFLLPCLISGKNISQIFRILLVFHNHNITTGQTFVMPHISNRFRNILNALTSDRKQNIPIFKVFRAWDIFKLCMRNTFIKPCVISRIDFAVSNAGHSILSYLVTFNA